MPDCLYENLLKHFGLLIRDLKRISLKNTNLFNLTPYWRPFVNVVKEDKEDDEKMNTLNHFFQLS